MIMNHTIIFLGDRGVSKSEQVDMDLTIKWDELLG